MAAPQPDEISLATKILGALSTLAAGLIAGGIALWKGTNKRVAAVELALKDKADNTELTRVRNAQVGIFEQMRDDKAETLGAIKDLTGAFNGFAQRMTEEMGKRPTRDELRTRRGD